MERIHVPTIIRPNVDGGAVAAQNAVGDPGRPMRLQVLTDVLGYSAI